jgi:glycerol kinase
VLAEARSPLATRTPRPEWVEHDPRDLLHGTTSALSAALRMVGRKPCVVGLTTQRSTVLLWDRATGRPLTPAVSWQDRRAVDVCRSLAAHVPRIRRVTGLFLSPTTRRPKSGGCWIASLGGSAARNKETSCAGRSTPSCSGSSPGEHPTSRIIPRRDECC